MDAPTDADPGPADADAEPESDGFSPTRRQMLAGAGGMGILAATSQVQVRPHRSTTSAGPAQERAQDQPTEQDVHLAWGSDPATTIAVSWTSPVAAAGARVLLTGGDGWTRTVMADQEVPAGEASGLTTWAYRAEFRWLAPDTSYSYLITSDNDGPAKPFSGRFLTSPVGRAPLRFTSGAYAVTAVESVQPLFHLLNGDPRVTTLNPSAASRPWIPWPEGSPIRVGSVLIVPITEDDNAMEHALAAGREDQSVDWIIALGDRQDEERRPLFDRYQADPVPTGDQDGITVFDVNPGKMPGGPTSLAVGHSDGTERTVLTRRRRDEHPLGGLPLGGHRRPR